MGRIVIALVVAAAAIAVCAPNAAARVSAFKSPTGNIICVLDTTLVRSDIRRRAWSPPPKPRSCPVDYGQGLTVDRRGRGRFVCAGDAVVDATRTAAYGSLVRRGRFACRVRVSGVRCLNARSRHGFALSRQGYRRF